MIRNFLTKRRPLASVSFNVRAVSGPWGGSSPFVAQIAEYLKQLGFSICYDLRRRVDIIFLIDPRADQRNKCYGVDAIAAYKDSNPGVKVIHRINECDQRKDTAFMDIMLQKANQVADYTVFISAWLANYHQQRWFDPAEDHGVIYNGADAAVFHPLGSRCYRRGKVLRIITHHWSNHLLKGFDVYEEVDNLIAHGHLKDVELVVMGRYPESIRWQCATLIAPQTAERMAGYLRSCHAYLTASRWEPCGMHHVEGAQCGLPLLYHEDGGGIVEAGQKYGIGFRKDVASAIFKMKDNWTRYRQKVLQKMPSGQRMCNAYLSLIFRLLADNPRSVT